MIKLTIFDVLSGHSQQDLNILESARAEVASIRTTPSIEDVRAALASVPGSLSQDVTAERGDY